MNAASEWLDKLVIAELAQTERVARDTRRWDLMADCYHPDSRVFLSWFDGTAAEFIAASKAMGEEPGGHAIHSLGPTLVRVAGDRALADTPCAILFRRVFAGVECDMTSYCRHYSRVERVEGRWRLRSFVGVYEKNTLAPVVPGQVPAIDTAKLATFRASYAFQAYFRAQQGKPVNDDRPGLDRPDLVERFHDAEDRWLAGADVPLGVGEP
ncbi:nuclear transport factor 2 family protein [Acrocarpospora catenulata]|uniref:nuclear transport factor 2 family protein n=1 Tax=Acrocarpospora catenulata TaxID=2836182 RepID=UPI001BD9D9FF|nr:nuclear transport factor 2 family protein [Acrocarpospora catenulata]